MGAINRNSSQVPTDSDTGKDELEIETQLWRSVLISFHPTKQQCIISIAKIYLKWRNTLFFRGINLILSQYLEAMIDASQGRGEQENHNSALLLQGPTVESYQQSRETAAAIRLILHQAAQKEDYS